MIKKDSIKKNFINYQQDAKKVLFNFLGLVPGQHSLSKETDALLKMSFDKNNDLETNKALLYAIARKKQFNVEDQKFILDILNDTKTYKEDLRKIATSALGLSIIENFESEKFGLSYLQDQVKSLDPKKDNYLYK